MTSLRDRPNTALLVVDVQNDVVANAYQRDEVIATICDLIDKGLYAFEWGAGVRMRGGCGLAGQVTPPVWSRTRSR